MVKSLVVVAEHRFGEFDQEAAQDDAAIVLYRAVDAVEVLFFTSLFLPLTEPDHMTGSSIDTLIDSGHPGREQRNLGSVNGTRINHDLGHLRAG